MRIVIFKEYCPEKIVSYSYIPDEFTDDWLSEKVREYNTKHTNAMAYIEFVESGSVVEFLVKRLEEKNSYPKELLEDAINCIDDARNAVEALRNTVV